MWNGGVSALVYLFAASRTTRSTLANRLGPRGSPSRTPSPALRERGDIQSDSCAKDSRALSYIASKNGVAFGEIRSKTSLRRNGSLR